MPDLPRNPGVRCDQSTPCKARVKLASDTTSGRVDALEKRLASLESRIAALEDAEQKAE